MCESGCIVKTYLYLRRPLRRFARFMEITLRRHDGRRGHRGWTDCGGLGYLQDRLEIEAKELRKVIDEVIKKEDTPTRAKAAAELIREASDVANFAMMITDIARSQFELWFKTEFPEGLLDKNAVYAEKIKCMECSTTWSGVWIPVGGINDKAQCPNCKTRDVELVYITKPE